MVGHAYRRHPAPEHLAVARDTHAAVAAGHSREPNDGRFDIIQVPKKVKRAVLLRA
jgi:hypothetical protein